MVARTPLVMAGGTVQELPAGDTLIATDAPALSRTLSHSNGGIGPSYLSIGPVTVNTVCSFRLPVRLPCSTTQWRLKGRNYDQLNVAAKTGFTLDQVIKGDMTAASTGATGQTGTFVGNVASTIFSGSAAIPGDGSFWVSDWVTAAADQFVEGKDHLVGIRFHTAASLAVQCGIGQCWRWSTVSGTDPTVAGSGGTVSFIPGDWVIEYQTTSRKRATLVIGDSIPEGTQGISYLANSSTSNIQPTAWWRGMWEQWAARRGDMLIQRNCLFGSYAQQWANSSFGGWGRQAINSGVFDIAVITLGINDLTAGRTFAQLQADYINCIANVRALVGNSIPLYCTNLMPNSLTATGLSSPEGYRQQFNNWLSSYPGGVSGVIDLDSEVRTAASSVTSTVAVDLAMTSDGVHPSYQGTSKLTDVLLTAIP